MRSGATSGFLRVVGVMNSCKMLILSAVALASAAKANAYEWLNNQHACVVENANFMSANGVRSGAWGNAPKSFFVDVTECRNFALANGLPYEVDFATDDSKNGQRHLVNLCVADVSGDYIVELKGIESFFEPFHGEFFGRFPLSYAGMTVFFHDDGYMDFSNYGKGDGEHAIAWFMFRANCTALRR